MFKERYSSYGWCAYYFNGKFFKFSNKIRTSETDNDGVCNSLACLQTSRVHYPPSSISMIRHSY